RLRASTKMCDRRVKSCERCLARGSKRSWRVSGAARTERRRLRRRFLGGGHFCRRWHEGFGLKLVAGKWGMGRACARGACENRRIDDGEGELGNGRRDSEQEATKVTKGRGGSIGDAEPERGIGVLPQWSRRSLRIEGIDG